MRSLVTALIAGAGGMLATSAFGPRLVVRVLVVVAVVALVAAAVLVMALVVAAAVGLPPIAAAPSERARRAAIKRAAARSAEHHLAEFIGPFVEVFCIDLRLGQVPLVLERPALRGQAWKVAADRKPRLWGKIPDRPYLREDAVPGGQGLVRNGCRVDALADQPVERLSDHEPLTAIGVGWTRRNQDLAG